MATDEHVVVDQTDPRRRRSTQANRTPQPDRDAAGLLALQRLVGNRAMEFGSTKIRSSGGVDSMIHLMHALAKIRDYEKQQRVKHKPARIILHGSASADGAEAANVTLSQARAGRIKELLVEADVHATIETIGHGATGTFPDLASNRCVLIELIGDEP